MSPSHSKSQNWTKNRINNPVITIRSKWSVCIACSAALSNFSNKKEIFASGVSGTHVLRIVRILKEPYIQVQGEARGDPKGIYYTHFRRSQFAAKWLLCQVWRSVLSGIPKAGRPKASLEWTLPQKNGVKSKLFLQGRNCPFVTRSPAGLALTRSVRSFTKIGVKRAQGGEQKGGNRQKQVLTQICSPPPCSHNPGGLCARSCRSSRRNRSWTSSGRISPISTTQFTSFGKYAKVYFFKENQGIWFFGRILK